MNYELRTKRCNSAGIHRPDRTTACDDDDDNDEDSSDEADRHCNGNFWFCLIRPLIRAFVRATVTYRQSHLHGMRTGEQSHIIRDRKTAIGHGSITRNFHIICVKYNVLMIAKLNDENYCGHKERKSKQEHKGRADPDKFRNLTDTQPNSLSKDTSLVLCWNCILLFYYYWFFIIVFCIMLKLCFMFALVK